MKVSYPQIFPLFDKKKQQHKSYIPWYFVCQNLKNKHKSFHKKITIYIEW